MLGIPHTVNSPLSWVMGIWSIAPDRQTWIRWIRLGWALCPQHQPCLVQECVCGTDHHTGSPLPWRDICSCFLCLEVATNPSVLHCHDFCFSYSATRSAFRAAFCKLCDIILQCWHKELLWLKDLSGQNHLSVSHITLHDRKFGIMTKVQQEIMQASLTLSFIKVLNWCHCFMQFAQ